LNYKLIIFDMDGTLLAGRTIYALAGALGFEGQLNEVMKSDMPKYVKTREIAKLLKGSSVERFLEIFDAIPLQNGAPKTIAAVKKAGMTTVIATDSYKLAADRLAQRLGIDRVFSYKLAADRLAQRLGIDRVFANELDIKDEKFTGRIRLNNQRLEPRMPGCKVHSICKRDILHNLCDELGIGLAESVAVGDGNIDRCMIEDAGLGIAFEAPPTLNEVADIMVNGNLSKMLRHIL